MGYFREVRKLLKEFVQSTSLHVSQLDEHGRLPVMSVCSSDLSENLAVTRMSRRFRGLE